MEALLGAELGLAMRSKGVTLEELLEIRRRLAPSPAPAGKPELAVAVRLALNDFQCETEYRLFMRMEVEDWLVTGLDVSDTSIAGELLCALLSDARSRVTCLNLCNTRFALWRASMVSSSIANLLVLNLSWNGLRDLSKVTFPSNLRELNVSHNELGDGFCAQIVGTMPCLEVLNMEGNSVGASGLGMLARRAKWKALLTKGSGPEAMDSDSALAVQWQLVGKHLTELSLDVDSLGVFGFAFPLADERCQLILLSLSCLGGGGGEDSATLRARKRAFKAFCLGLASNRSLTRVSLDGFGLTAKCTLGLSKAAAKTRITELSLRNCFVREVGLGHLLAHCGAGLRGLDLEANEIRSVRCVTRALLSNQLCGLHVLNLNHNQITEDGNEFIQALRHAHSGLRDVNGKGNPGLPNELLRHTLDCVRAGRGLLVLRRSPLRRLPIELLCLVGRMLCGSNS